MVFSVTSGFEKQNLRMTGRSDGHRSDDCIFFIQRAIKISGHSEKPLLLAFPLNTAENTQSVSENIFQNLNLPRCKNWKKKTRSKDG